MIRHRNALSVLWASAALFGCSANQAQSLRPESNPTSICDLAHIQKAYQTMRLEKVRDVKHLIQQIYSNLGNDILCAAPEWLEEQWGIRIFGWRTEKGLDEYSIQWEAGIVGGRQIHPAPLDRYIVRFTAGQLRGAPRIFLDIDFANGYRLANESIIPIPEIFAILGNPDKKAIFRPQEAPPNPNMAVPPPFPRSGDMPSTNLWWYPFKNVAVFATTNLQSQIQDLRFEQTIVEGAK